MNFGLLRRIGLLLAPDVALAAGFAIAWLTPQAPGAETLAQCRLIMVMEGITIVASALVGVYVEVSRLFLPLIVVGCIVWFVQSGAPGDWLLVFCFVWYVASAFVDCILARRGYFGPARDNPAHPHRRYDRMLFLYLITSPVLVVLRIAGDPLRWAVWGTIYFTLLAAADTILRDPFDRIPQGVVRRLREWSRSDVAPQMGVCMDCVHVQPAIPSRPGRMVRCGLSATDRRFQEYPPTPVRACEGFRLSASHRKNE